MNVISQEELRNIEEGKIVTGVCLIQSVAVKTARNGSRYLEGKVISGESVSFKIWGGDLFNKLIDDVATLSGTVASISARGNDYNGLKSLIIEDLIPVAGYKPEDFMATKYNIESYWSSLKQTVSKTVSDVCMKAVLNPILFENPEVSEMFKKAFAATSHHDNCKGGLLAHTYRVYFLANYMIQLYPHLTKSEAKGTPTQTQKDLILAGVLLHDIGKILEMESGSYTMKSRVTHRILGLEYLFEHKKEIVGAYGEKWFYDLESIIVQHHGEFGDAFRTVPAFVVGMCDRVDTYFTTINELEETSANVQTSGESIKMGDLYLSL